VWTKDALFLVGHGSPSLSDSGRCLLKHAENIRNRKLFSEVYIGFYKEEPNFLDVLKKITEKRVYVVPFFVSHGHFTKEVLRNELKGEEILHCEPVGLNLEISNVILNLVKVGIGGCDAQDVCLVVIGHGTKDGNWKEIVQKQVEIINSENIFGECIALYLEEEPFLKNWKEVVKLYKVVAVPFFMMVGTHVKVDIPKALGIEYQKNPSHIENYEVWCTDAVGESPMMVDVILDQVKASK
jgi:sirohydrochlorin cobaltochelatase